MTLEYRGNDNLRKRIESVLAQESGPHAFLFTGPRAVGKATFARKLARDHVGGRQEYIREITLKNEEKSRIDVGTIRELKRSMNLGHEQLPRVGIIDDAHKMTMAAQNAFLKILEEPDSGVKFFLITPFFGGVLETIRSRTQQYAFAPLPDDEMAILSQEIFPQYGAEEIATLTCGRVGWLLKMARDETFFQARKGGGRLFPLLSQRSTHERLLFAQKLSEDKERMADFLERWVEYLRRTSRTGRQDEGILYNRIERIQHSLFLLHFGTTNTRLLAESLLIDV